MVPQGIKNFPQNLTLGEEKADSWFQLVEFISKEKISRGFDNSSDNLPGEAGARQGRVMWVPCYDQDCLFVLPLAINLNINLQLVPYIWTWASLGFFICCSSQGDHPE